MAANPDIALLHAFLRDGGGPRAFDTNALAAALGARFERYDRALGRLALSFRPSPLFIQGAGFIQGGALASMLDFAMAFAALAGREDADSVATASLSVSFVAGARGGPLRADGIVERAGRSLVHTRAELWAGAEDLVATAQSVLAVRCSGDADVAPVRA